MISEGPIVDGAALETSLWRPSAIKSSPGSSAWASGHSPYWASGLSEGPAAGVSWLFLFFGSRPKGFPRWLRHLG